MSLAETDPLDLALRLARELEARGVSYALGGALAYGLWAVPRSTADVDVNVFVEIPGLGPVLDSLGACGAAVDPARASAAAAAEGMFEAWAGTIRLDVFVPSIDFSREAEKTRVRRDIGGQPAWFLAAESLAVFKLLFFRPKDIADLERLLALQRGKLDAAYVRGWLVRLMGEDDERVRKWDELVKGAG